MKEMVGGCCVCSDERGWPDNPLVYCDGNGCTVAVHQACYGIVTVPTGPWFCRKCESSDRQAKVRCELCPSRAGALKRADTGGWAHVVCALYIPEIRFGNVTSMEPIILQLIPPERFNKVCCICQEMGKTNRASVGACMQCNKSGCKQQFHVTCAQSFGLLCEEAGNYLDNVKYCGYCRHHYSKLRKGGNVKTIPPYKPVSQDSQSSDSCPEKEAEEITSGSPNLQSKGVTSKSAIGTGNTTGSGASSGTNRKSSGQQAVASTSKSGNPPASKVVSSSASVQIYTTTASEVLPSTSGITSGSKQVIQSKSVNPPPKVQGKSQPPEKSSSSKKVSVGDTTKRSSSAAPPAESADQPVNTASTIVAPPTSTQIDQSTADTSSFYQEIVNPVPTSSKPVVQPEPVVVSGGVLYAGPSVVTGPSSASGDSQPGGQKFTNSNFTESIITNSDSVFGLGAETKHTKKRKAANLVPVSNKQRTSEDVNVESNYEAIDEVNCEESSVVNPATAAIPKSQVALELSSSNIPGRHANPPHHYMNVPMDPHLYACPYHPGMQPSPSMNPIPSTSVMHTMNMERNPGYPVHRHPQNIPHTSVEHPNPPQQNMPHNIPHSQGVRQQYANPGPGSRPEMGRPEMPTSLVVSVPLPQSSQGLNLSAHQSSTSGEAPTIPHTSSSGWGLKVAYEPQTSKMSSEPSTSTAPSGKRPRVETIDLCGSSSSAKSSSLEDELGAARTNGARNKKRAAMTAMAAAHTAIPSTSAAPSLSLPSSSHMGAIPKRSMPPQPMPSTSHQEPPLFVESPHISPNTEYWHQKHVKPHLDRMGRAPHMLGNELNPESAVAARLSEQLNAELAAHSCFREPSPLVPPPLINKATGRNSGIVAIPSSQGMTGNAQSLDQLLERQWEQGSQFLMEQAQHFDSKVNPLLVASLLSCLHQLRTENVRLEEHVGSLQQRRDHLLAVNARLAIPLATQASNITADARNSRDSMSRQPAPVRADGNINDRSQQLTSREMQPRSS